MHIKVINTRLLTLIEPHLNINPFSSQIKMNLENNFGRNRKEHDLVLSEMEIRKYVSCSSLF